MFGLSVLVVGAGDLLFGMSGTLGPFLWSVFGAGCLSLLWVDLGLLLGFGGIGFMVVIVLLCCFVVLPLRLVCWFTVCLVCVWLCWFVCYWCGCFYFCVVLFDVCDWMCLITLIVLLFSFLSLVVFGCLLLPC